MENEIEQFVLVYWKKQLGKPLRPKEEAIWREWLQLQDQEISWEQLQAELLLEAQMRSFTDENLKVFQDTFKIRYGVTISEKDNSSF